MKDKLKQLFILTLLLISLPNAVASAQASCAQQGTGAEVALTVPNLTDQRLLVYWLDTQCSEQLISAVKSGGILYQTTREGDKWVIRDRGGALIDEITASASTPIIPVGVISYNPEPITTNCSAADTGQEIDLTVVNQSDEPVLLSWISYECAEMLYEVVPGQAQFIQPTYVGHDWVIRYPGGRIGKHITVSTSANMVMIDPPPASPGTTTATESPAATPETADTNYPITESGCEVQPVTADLGLDDFYTKYCDYNELLIVSSDDTDDAALEQAWLIAANMLYNRPDVVESLVKMNFKVVVLSIIEFNSDIPEFAELAADPSFDIDDFRAYAKVLEEPRLVTVPEENLLCLMGDNSAGASLFVDSLANLTRFALVRDLEPAMGDKVEAARQNAIANGIWSPSPWITESNGVYWNYGVQTYFNASYDALLTGPTDDYTNTRDELASYDPRLFALIDEVYGTEDWTPVCPGA